MNYYFIFVEEAEEKREHANKMKREREANKKKEVEVVRVENIQLKKDLLKKNAELLCCIS
jgi:hypothetical protein